MYFWSFLGNLELKLISSYTPFPTACVGNTPILPFSIFDNGHVEINNTFLIIIILNRQIYLETKLQLAYQLN